VRFKIFFEGVVCGREQEADWSMLSSQQQQMCKTKNVRLKHQTSQFFKSTVASHAGNWYGFCGRTAYVWAPLLYTFKADWKKYYVDMHWSVTLTKCYRCAAVVLLRGRTLWRSWYVSCVTARPSWWHNTSRQYCSCCLKLLQMSMYATFSHAFHFATLGDLKNRSDLVLRPNRLSERQITR